MENNPPKCDWCGNQILSVKNVKFLRLKSGIETRCYTCFLISDKNLEWIPEEYEIKRKDKENE